MRSVQPTLRDLRQEAEGPVPVMLAVTVLVQILRILEQRQRDGLAVGELTLDDVIVTGAPPRALIDDPSRDPKARLAEASAVREPRSAERLTTDQGASRLFRQLVVDSDDAVPPIAAGLLERLAPLSLEESLAAARELGLQLFAAWVRARDCESSSSREGRRQRVVQQACEEVELRQRMMAALEAGHRQQVLQHGRKLSQVLGEAASADPDLTIAGGWLEEQEERRSQQQEEAKKTSLKLFLTGAPLVLATLLTGLLGVVMLFST